MSPTTIGVIVAVGGCLAALGANELWRRKRIARFCVGDVCSVQERGGYAIAKLIEVRDTDLFLLGGFVDTRDSRHGPGDYRPTALAASLTVDSPRLEWFTSAQLRKCRARVIWRGDGTHSVSVLDYMGFGVYP